MDVETGTLLRDLDGDRPDPDRPEHSKNLRIIEVHFYATELRKLRDLPENDGRDGPLSAAQDLHLGSGELIGYGKQEDVRVKI